MKVWMLPVFAALITLALVLVPGATTSTVHADAGACGIEGFDVPDSGANFDFTAACEAHDTCYADGGPNGLGTEAERKACDQAFLADMLGWCSDSQGTIRLWICSAVAKTYFAGVRLFGWLTFNYADPI